MHKAFQQQQYNLKEKMMPKVKFLKGCIYSNGKHAKVGDILNIEDNEFKSLKRMGKVELFKENEDNKMTDMGEQIATTEPTNIDDVVEAGDASEAISKNIIDVIANAETEEMIKKRINAHKKMKGQ